MIRLFILDYKDLVTYINDCIVHENKYIDCEIPALQLISAMDNQQHYSIDVKEIHIQFVDI